MGENTLHDALTVDIGPIETLEVKENRFFADTANLGVIPGNLVGDEDHIAVFGATKTGFVA
tara:strand:+ start:850 stop:1032 length:183 start_codon:yes stop_codon:yes gene_type:complete